MTVTIPPDTTIPIYTLAESSGVYIRGHWDIDSFCSALHDQLNILPSMSLAFHGYVRHVRYDEGMDARDNDLEYWVKVSKKHFPGAFRATCYNMGDLLS